MEAFGSKKQVSIAPEAVGNPLAQQNNVKIFISHSSKDLAVVNKFIDSILILGLGLKREEDIFCTSADGTNVKSGFDFKSAIKKELATAKAVIQIITKNYKSSEVCLNEMGAAWVTSNRVIPLIASPFNYDVGFIHASSAQLMLNRKEDLLKFFDDHKTDLFKEKINVSNYSRQVDEFVAFMSRLSSESKSRTDKRFFFDEVVTVMGILKEDIFQHPNETHHRYYYVELLEPVDVLSNEMIIEEGNFNTSSMGISKMHITPKEGTSIGLKQFRDKEVLITGTCWGGHTAWHQTEVMMSFESISLIG